MDFGKDEDALSTDLTIGMWMSNGDWSEVCGVDSNSAGRLDVVLFCKGASKDTNESKSGADISKSLDDVLGGK